MGRKASISISAAAKRLDQFVAFLSDDGTVVGWRCGGTASSRKSRPLVSSQTPIVFGIVNGGSSYSIGRSARLDGARSTGDSLNQNLKAAGCPFLSTFHRPDDASLSSTCWRKGSFGLNPCDSKGCAS